ncbi:MAG: HAD family hydrolase [Dehalococcoidia bacterium]|nr:HAD family hydrolase [Dehalococcoidia bacterium]
MSRPRPALRAVTFDLGDTLWHFPHRPPEAEVAAELTRRLAHLLRAWGLTPTSPPEEIQQRIADARAEAERTSEAAGGLGPDYLGRVRAELHRAGLHLADQQVTEAWHSQNIGGAFLGRVLFEDTLPTLDWLRGRGLLIAALTNRSHGGASFLEELRAYDLLPRFDAVISSDQVGHRKPHPAIFQRTIEVLGVRADECAHVGDRLDVDVRGAKAFGMTAIWYRGGTPATAPAGELPDAPDYVIDRLSELLDLDRLGERETHPLD